MAAERRAWSWALGGWVGLLLVLTLVPQAQVRGVNLVPLVEVSRAIRSVLASPHPSQHPAFQYLLVQVVGNVVAFVPLGFAAAGLFSFRSPRLGAAARAVATGFGLSLSIELLQLMLATRATDVDDLIFNTTGTVLGAALLLLWTGRPRPAATVR